jgi:hypothetical protein
MLYTSPCSRFELATSVAIGTDCICSFKSNYHAITTITAPPFLIKSFSHWGKWDQPLHKALFMLIVLCSNSPCSNEHKLLMYNIAHNPSLNNFWFVDKTNKDKLTMKLSGAVTISIYYLSIIHHHIHIIIYNNENPLWKETLSVLLLYNYISIKKKFNIEIYTTIVDISIISLIK